MDIKSRNQIIFQVLVIFIGEILIFLGNPLYGLYVHIINLHVIFVLFITDRNIFIVFKDQNVKPIFQSLILLLLLRIINMSTPIFFISIIIGISILYGIMFIPIFYLLKNQNFSLKEIGLQCTKKIYIPSYFPISILIGYLFALIEFQIIHPEPIIDNLSFSNVIILILVMFIFVGLVEELIFRSILQTRLENAFGAKSGLILTSVLFGVMHSGYGILNEIIFAGFAGLIIGFIFQKTRCLPFVVGIHSTINIFLFGIFPLLFL